MLSAIALLIICTCAYFTFGIATQEDVIAFKEVGIASEAVEDLARLSWRDIKNWVRVGLYGIQVMTLLKPTDLQPLGLVSTGIKVVQSLLGPLILGLFALALRQRLRR